MTDTAELVERLRKRRVFLLNGHTWMMGVDLDPDCREAADALEQMKDELKTTIWMLEQDRESLAKAQARIAELETKLAEAHEGYCSGELRIKELEGALREIVDVMDNSERTPEEMRLMERARAALRSDDKSKNPIDPMTGQPAQEYGPDEGESP